MLGNLSLLNQTFIEVWAGRLAFRLALCLMALSRAPRPPREQGIIVHLQTPSTACTILISVTRAFCRQIAVSAAGLQAHSCRLFIPTITPASLVELTYQQRQPTRYHSVSLTGSGFLRNDDLVFESQHSYYMPEVKQYLCEVRHCEKANTCVSERKLVTAVSQQTQDFEMLQVNYLITAFSFSFKVL